MPWPESTGTPRDSSLWPPAEDGKLSALHQAISDLHHLVGEHVVLRNPSDSTRAAELGIDLIERFDEGEVTPESVLSTLPQIQR